MNTSQLDRIAQVYTAYCSFSAQITPCHALVRRGLFSRGRVRKFRLTTTSRVRARRPTLGVRAAAAMPINKLANTRKSKTNSIPKLDLALTFLSHTHETTKVSCQATCHCTCCAFSLSFCRATCLNQARAYMHIVLQSLCKFQLKQKRK